MSALERVKDALGWLGYVSNMPQNFDADLREVVALAERAAHTEKCLANSQRVHDGTVAEWKSVWEETCAEVDALRKRATKAEAERDEARAEVERLRRSLVDLTGDKSAGDLPEKTVLGVLMQRDEARAQAASALRHADLLRREMEPCEVHHGARRACGQCLSSAEAHAKDLRAQLATVAERVEQLLSVPLADASFKEGVRRAASRVRSGPTTTAVDATPLVTGPAPISERERATKEALEAINNCITWSDGMQMWHLIGRERTQPALTLVRAALAAYAEVK